MQKILIASASSVITEAISALLSSDYEVHTCDSLADLMCLLDSLQPDAVIVSAPLAGIDGLMQISSAVPLPRILVILTNIITEQLLQTAQAIHASYISLVPFHGPSLQSKLNDLLRK